MENNFLKRRFKVIGNYPTSFFDIGDIIQEDSEDPDLFTIPTQPYKDSIFCPWSFPALFEELRWWQERGAENMPKYLKQRTNRSKKVFKVIQWHTTCAKFLTSENKWVYFYVLKHFPITEKEYNEIL